MSTNSSYQKSYRALGTPNSSKLRCNISQIKTEKSFPLLPSTDRVVDSAQPWISTSLLLLLSLQPVPVFFIWRAPFPLSHSFSIHFFLHPIVFSPPKLSSFCDKKTHEKLHVPTLLFITGINILVNNLINHMRLRTVGANPTAMVVHPFGKWKWKCLKGWSSKKQKTHMAKTKAIP